MPLARACSSSRSGASAPRSPHRQQLGSLGLDSAFRESAVAVIECCRDAAALVASRWIWQEIGDESILRKDLSYVAECLATAPRNKKVAANAARTLAILHSRGKSNEQFDKGLNPPTDEDTEYALHAVALILRELGWALSRA